MPNKKTLLFSPLVFGSVIFVANIVGARIQQAMGVTSPNDEKVFLDWKLYAGVGMTAAIANILFGVADNIFEAIKEKIQKVQGSNWKQKLVAGLKFTGLGTLIFSQFIIAGLGIHQLAEGKQSLEAKDLTESLGLIGLATLATTALAAITHRLGIPMPAELVAQFGAGMATSAITDNIGKRHIDDGIKQMMTLIAATTAAVFLAGLVTILGKGAATRCNSRSSFLPAVPADVGDRKPLLETNNSAINSTEQQSPRAPHTRVML